MSAAPFFWSTPLKYCRWAAREKPALFWSVVIGAAGPLAMPIGPPIRRWLGDVDPAPVPVTYPGTSHLFLLAPVGNSLRDAIRSVPLQPENLHRMV
ncbi:NADH-ubiquinone oxidoreductase 9.5 kDa subunit [Beauveria brongniartii RCEF 3172]|uniref:NADH-ubiquinone oxidoreductase 9.5 kDa subunit n=1 Tax=Beauveria brongniartii RCEF 3172 TaxID=1081107 RepID=A0A167DSN8_9HYPO|nr:NADH-ubiquinone oxidoreductase 9.5 kDa subunit [Beauveria brongniartii RCEF 3172]